MLIVPNVLGCSSCSQARVLYCSEQAALRLWLGPGLLNKIAGHETFGSGQHHANDYTYNLRFVSIRQAIH